VAGKGQGKTRLGRSFVETVPTLFGFCYDCEACESCESSDGICVISESEWAILLVSDPIARTRAGSFATAPSFRVGSSAVAFQISMLLVLHSRGASGHCAGRDIIHALASRSSIVTGWMASEYGMKPGEWGWK
jgi:hypothetical protein